jgi:methyl-accepting chemotaxis protein
MNNFTFSVRSKIIMAVILPVAGMVLFGLLDVLDQREALTSSRKIHVQQIVEAGLSILDHYHGLAEKGALTDAEARDRAKADIRDIRYGKGDYLFIYRSDGITEVLGTAPQLEGKQRIDTLDPDGVPFVKLLIESAKSGGGFVAYAFPRKAGDPPVPKISTSSYFAPWDMVIASGVYLDDIDEAFRHQLTRLGIILALVVGAILTFSLRMVRTISRPLSEITGLMDRLSRGDRDISVPYTDKPDEIGKLARALDVFRGQAIKIEQQAQEQLLAEGRMAESRTSERRAIAGEFEGRVLDLLTGSSTSSADMHAAAESMSQVSHKALSQASAAAAAAEEATSNVQTVAAASEELYSSISEISRQVSESAKISSDAAKETHRINAMMGDLSAAATRIGEVVKLVNDIASQTNLLALNATIEAARAGEAGKGFAVVAGEVKTLATQTARATDEITTQIGAVQDETNKAVAAIRAIGRVIEQIEEISSGIASAVEEQGAATQEIARNVSQAAAGTNEVSMNVGGLTQAASATEGVAARVLAAAGDQTRYADRLRLEINEFLAKMRS